MNTQTVNLLAEFAAHRDLAGFQPDSMGRYALTIDDWTVRVFQIGRSLYLEATLGVLPPERPSDPDPLIDMLGMSLAGLACHEEILTLDAESGTEERLCLYRVLPLATLGLATFELALESFVNRLEHWGGVFARGSRAVPEPPMPMHVLFP